MPDENETEEPSHAPRPFGVRSYGPQRDAEARLAEYERRDVLRDAGLDLTNPLHVAVAKSYDGELDAAQAKAWVEGLGLTSTAEPAPPPPPPEVVAQDAVDAASLGRIAEVAMGGGTPPPAGDRRAELAQEMEAAYRRKANPAELDAIVNRFTEAGGFRTVTPS